MPQGYGHEAVLLKSWPEQETQVWELAVPRNPDERPDIWIKRLSRVVDNLGGYAWCVNTQELVQNLQMPPGEALHEWGRFFWPAFKGDGLFFFTADSHGEIIRQQFLKWQASETTICFRRKYDLTLEQSPGICSKKTDGSIRHFLNPLKETLGLLRQDKN